MIDICLIVPTHNRPEKLKKSLINWLNVLSNSKLSIVIYIVDNSTDDRTYELNLKNFHPNVMYKKRDVVVPTANRSIHKALFDVDIGAKWYWWLGDDDYLLLEGFIAIENTLKTFEHIDYVHATDATFILSNEYEISFFEDLLNKYGFLEILSFMSSQIFSRNVFLCIRKYLLESELKIDWDFNFNHSIFLFLGLMGKKGLIVPTGCIIAQSHVHQDHSPMSSIDFRNHVLGWMTLVENLKRWPDLISLVYKDSFYNYRKSPVIYLFLLWQIKIALAEKKALSKRERYALQDLSRARTKNVRYYISTTESVIAAIDRYHYSQEEVEMSNSKNHLLYLSESIAKLLHLHSNCE